MRGCRRPGSMHALRPPVSAVSDITPISAFFTAKSVLPESLHKGSVSVVLPGRARCPATVADVAQIRLERDALPL